MKLAAIDAETKPIELRPEYPPRAVGYAVKHGRTSKYLAFGHPSGNNCTRGEAVRYVKTVLKDHTPIFHHADFDLEVMERDGIKVRGEYHDTLRLAFLNEPRSLDLGLKPQAKEWLGEPPDEQDMLKAWILEHIKPKRKSEWGRYICETPGRLCGVYARGDAERTMGLYRYLEREVIRGGMAEAYEREMALIPIKLDMEQRGIRVRMKKLKRELPIYERAHKRAARLIRKRLRVGKDFNIGSSKQLAVRLLELGVLDPVVRTAPTERHPHGQISTKRELLETNCTDKRLVELLSVYGVLSTYLSTFLNTWIERGEADDNYIHPGFNTVRNPDEYGGKRSFGTRTGRLSSYNPNFHNIPKNAQKSANKATLLLVARFLRDEGLDFIGLRDYFEPDEGCVFLRRDYSQQELRILAHFEDGAFLQMYMADPTMDAHDAVGQLVQTSSGLVYTREYIKNTNFGIIYGMGLKRLAIRLGISEKEAKVLKKAVMRAMPGIQKLSYYLMDLADNDEPFYTWGGREYYCEEPQYIKTEDGGKRLAQFKYKMINTLIQGSAADCTKQGMINTFANLRHGRLVLQVHDELVVSVPKEHAKKEMKRMKEAMEDVKFKVPMLTDGEIGATSWARLRGMK